MNSRQNRAASLPLDLPSDLGRVLEALRVRESFLRPLYIALCLLIAIALYVLADAVWVLIATDGDVQRMSRSSWDEPDVWVKYTWPQVMGRFAAGAAILLINIGQLRGLRRLQKVGGGLYFCEHGLFWRRADETHVIRWENIDRIEVLGSRRKIPPEGMAPDLLSPDNPAAYIIYRKGIHRSGDGTVEIDRRQGLHLGQLYQALKRRAAEHGIRFETPR
jgi:hypothetical protein